MEMNVNNVNNEELEDVVGGADRQKYYHVMCRTCKYHKVFLTAKEAEDDLMNHMKQNKHHEGGMKPSYSK